jgi:hypothetical protein
MFYFIYPTAYLFTGGKGKTFVYKCLINNCIEMGYDVIPIAWAGIAAMLLPGSCTLHSRFKLPLNLTDTSVSSLKIVLIAKRHELFENQKLFMTKRLWHKHMR